MPCGKEIVRDEGGVKGERIKRKKNTGRRNCKAKNKQKKYESKNKKQKS